MLSEIFRVTKIVGDFAETQQTFIENHFLVGAHGYYIEKKLPVLSSSSRVEVVRRFCPSGATVSLIRKRGHSILPNKTLPAVSRYHTTRNSSGFCPSTSPLYLRSILDNPTRRSRRPNGAPALTTNRGRWRRRSVVLD